MLVVLVLVLANLMLISISINKVLVPPALALILFSPLSPQGKDILSLEDASLPTIFKIRSSSHLILLIRTQQ